VPAFVPVLRHPRLLVAAAAVELSCTPAVDASTVTHRLAPVQQVRCRENLEGNELARLPAHSCSIVLIGDGARVRLGSLASDASLSARAPWPAGCDPDRCAFELEATTSGLVVWAWNPGADSEVPAGVWVGAPSTARHFGWVDLWGGAGEPSAVQGSNAGPTHGLRVHRCDAGLRLAIHARLPGADPLQAPPALASRVGDYSWDAASGEMVQGAGSLGGCVELRNW
jgi:hypothetical protein